MRMGAIQEKSAKRSWELKKVESIDWFDSMGSNVSICVRGNSIMRVLPVVNEGINEEWLTDKARFAYDGLRRQRLLQPMVKKNNKLVTVSWEECFSELVRRVFEKKYDFVGVVGNLVELESIALFKDLMASH